MQGTIQGSPRSALRRARRLPPVLALLLAWLLVASPLRAACSCSISASVAPPDLTLTSISSGACERLTGMGFLVDGGLVGSSAQFSVSTWTATITTTSACLRTGPHTATAACKCGEIIPVDFCADTSGTASTSFSVNSTPTVSVSADGPNDLGQVQLTVPYSFPNTIANVQRHLGVKVDGVDVVGVTSNSVSGTWTPLLETSCLSNGSHEVRVQATACNMPEDPAFLDVDTTTVQVDHQPQVSLALTPADPQNPEGIQTARATYHFPQTAAHLQRTLKLIAYPSQRVLFAFHPTPNPGTASTDVGCIPNDIVALVVTAERPAATARLRTGPRCPAVPRCRGKTTVTRGSAASDPAAARLRGVAVRVAQEVRPQDRAHASTTWPAARATWATPDGRPGTRPWAGIGRTTTRSGSCWTAASLAESG
jgi:hypothetical protein